jgi:glycosyltransferase involved in cell wall biosynthesis
MTARIGIDATALPPNPAGAGVYTIQLLRALVSLNAAVEYVVFIHPRGKTLLNLPDRPGLEWALIEEKSPAQRLIWEQSSLPWLARRHQIDLLHSLHYSRPAWLPCRSVVTFHDMTFFLYPDLHTRAKRIFFPLAIRYSARFSDALLAVSENTRRDALRCLKISPEMIFTTPNGIGEEFRPVDDRALRHAVRERYNLPERFILFVGTIEPRKNLPLLLRSYKHLVSQEPAIDLVIVGQLGWMFDEVMDSVKTLGLGERVHFTGYLPGEDLPIVYNLAELFIYPSLYEGFGFPPLEAMACGTPVITTAISSMADHIGEAGLLVSPEDALALAQSMQRLLNDPALRETLVCTGLQQAGQFTWKRTAQETLKVYQKVLAS